MPARETVGLGRLEQRKGLMSCQEDKGSGGDCWGSDHPAPMSAADRPTTGNLDGATARKSMELMKKINADFGTTFLFSTHDQEFMKKYANKIIELKDGRK